MKNINICLIVKNNFVINLFLEQHNLLIFSLANELFNHPWATPRWSNSSFFLN